MIRTTETVVLFHDHIKQSVNIILSHVVHMYCTLQHSGSVGMSVFYMYLQTSTKLMHFCSNPRLNGCLYIHYADVVVALS